jgi:UDP-N-acetylglucosamine 2-epimerase
VTALPALDLFLNVGHFSGAARAALAIRRFDAIVDEHRPAAVLAIGSSDCVLACALLAHKRQVHVLRSDAGQRRAWASPNEDTNSGLMDQFADVLYTCNLVTHYSLYRVGIGSERVQCVGDLAANVVRFAQASAPDHAALLARFGQAESQLLGRAGFALVTKQFRPLQTEPAKVFEAVSMLAAARAEVPLLWAVDGGTLLELKATGADVQVRAAGIVIATDLRYLDCIALLGQARCVIAGPEARFVDEARVLGTASIVIDSGVVVPVRVAEAAASGLPSGSHQIRKILSDILNTGDGRRDGTDFWDGGAALRIAAHLGPWVRKHNRSRARLRVAVPEAGDPERVPPEPAVHQSSSRS